MKNPVYVPKPLPEPKLAIRNHAHWKKYRQYTCEMRWKRAQAEVAGHKFRVTDEVCACGGHYKIVVCNGSGIGPPLCPIVVGLRRVRLALRDGRAIDHNLINNLLKEATIEDNIQG